MEEEELANIFVSQMKAIKYRLPVKHSLELLRRLQIILSAIRDYLGRSEGDEDEV
jgi:hypothetical protein